MLRRLEELPMAKAERVNRIAVTFHVPEGSSPAASALFLQNVVDDLFESAASHVQIGDQLSGELMFSFQKPLVSSSEEMETFFKKLQRLFTITRSHRPHFTQLPELTGGRN